MARSTFGNASADDLAAAWDGVTPDVFSATFRGTLVVLRDGTYTFALDADDGAALFVDGQLVVDNRGQHKLQRAMGALALPRGLHNVFLSYGQEGGSFGLEWWWARDDAPLRLVPSWAVRHGRARSLARAIPSLLLSGLRMVLRTVWPLTLLVVILMAATPSLRRVWARVRGSKSARALCWVVLGSVILNAVGVWWGLPTQWSQDELRPDLVFSGAAQHFANGWFSKYPPFHYYVLTMAMSPARIWAHELPGTPFVNALMLARVVSIIMATGIVALAGLCATRAFSSRAGVSAAAIMALVAPFVYYAKFANVDIPYLFWFGWSVWFYLGLFASSSVSNYVLFAVTGMLAICTKDQAYDLYVLAPVAIVARHWHIRRQAGAARAFRFAILDSRLWISAASAVVLFVLCHNLLFNWTGFVEHVRFLVGSGSETYVMFEPTAEGHLDLVRLTLHLIQMSLGWPSLVLAVGGLVIALRAPRWRGVAVWLLVPVVSYYATFINVVLYNYDRFVLPICFVLALFGGVAIDRLLTASGRRQALGTAVVWVVMSYGVLYATTVDVLMLDDSRYAAERWLSTTLKEGERVGLSGPFEVLPRLDGIAWVRLETVADLRRQCPAYYLVNADYARAVPPDSAWGEILTQVRDRSTGAALARHFRRPSPWAWLPGAHHDLVGPREETVVVSTLRNVNPSIEIYRLGTCAADPPKR